MPEVRASRSRFQAGYRVFPPVFCGDVGYVFVFCGKEDCVCFVVRLHVCRYKGWEGVNKMECAHILSERT